MGVKSRVKKLEKEVGRLERRLEVEIAPNGGKGSSGGRSASKTATSSRSVRSATSKRSRGRASDSRSPRTKQSTGK